MIPKSRFQPLSLGNLAPPQLGSTRIEGSPLKNVMVPSPTDPSPVVSPAVTGPSFEEFTIEVASHPAAVDMDGASTASEVLSEIMAHGLPPLLKSESVASSPRPSIKQEVATPPVELSAPPLKAEAADTPSGAPDHLPQDHPSRDAAEPEPAAEASPAPQITGPKPEPMEVDNPEAPSLQPPDSPALLPTVADDEDDSVNLLVPLERDLDRQESTSNDHSDAPAPNLPVAAVTKQETQSPAAAPSKEEPMETGSPVTAPKVEEKPVEHTPSPAIAPAAGSPPVGAPPAASPPAAVPPAAPSPAAAAPAAAAAAADPAPPVASPPVAAPPTADADAVKGEPGVDSPLVKLEPGEGDSDVNMLEPPSSD